MTKLNQTKQLEKHIKLLEETIKAQSRLLVSYRLGGKPPEWVFKTLDKARKAGVIK